MKLRIEAKFALEVSEDQEAWIHVEPETISVDDTEVHCIKFSDSAGRVLHRMTGQSDTTLMSALMRIQKLLMRSGRSYEWVAVRQVAQLRAMLFTLGLVEKASIEPVMQGEDCAEEAKKPGRYVVCCTREDGSTIYLQRLTDDGRWVTNPRIATVFIGEGRANKACAASADARAVPGAGLRWPPIVKPAEECGI